MAVLADAYVRARLDPRRLGPDLRKEGDKHGRVFGTSFVRASAGPFRSMGGILSRSLGGVVAGLGAIAGIKVFGGFIADAEASAKVSKLTASTIKATGGAAKITAQAVGDLATAISNKTGKDDEAIQSGQNMLLTFKGIRNEAGKNNDIFNQASSVLTDMVAAMNGGVVTEENMRKGGIQLGKALNDPIKGITALQRVGVTFTDQQKKQIAAMVKAGDVAGAQKVILAELKSEFGGAAAATSSAGDKMKVALSNLGERIGGFLLPAVSKVSKFVTDQFVPGLLAMFKAFKDGDVTSGGFIGAMERIGVTARKAFDYFKTSILPTLKDFGRFIIDKVVPALASMAQFIGRNHEIFVPLLAALAGAIVTIKIIAGVTKLWAAAQAILNVVMAANPIGIVIVAIAALTAGIIVAYKHSATFRKIVQAAWQGIQTAVSFAWNNVIKPVVTALVGFFRNVIAPTVLWLWRNIFAPAFKTIGFIVKAAWVIIQIALALMKWYLENVTFPVIRFLYNKVVKPIFQAAGAYIGFVWNKVIKPVFVALGNFIRTTVAPAFAKGVQAITAAWDKVKEAAAKPVRFVVNTVIQKGIINTINKVAGFFGIKSRIPPVHFAAGGRLPGPPSIRDNMIAHGPGGTTIGLATGEFVVNARQTAKHLPLLSAINAGVEGYADGGLIGFLKDPAGWVSSRAGIGRIAKKFGHNPLISILTGAAGKVRDWAIGKALNFLNIGFLSEGAAGALGSAAGGGIAGGALALLKPAIRGVLLLLRSAFGSVPLISGYRPGATTLSGNVSYHALGRAIDIAPVYAWATFLNRIFGRNLRELITPWNGLNILNGYPHRYTGAVWMQHNFAGGNAHIHAAMDNGGWLLPGLNIVPNNTGRPERVSPPGRGGDVHIHLHNAVITSKRAAVELVTEAYNTAVHERKIRP